MGNKDFLECCKVVLNFLLVANSESVILKNFNVPSNTLMNDTLAKHENFMINKVGGPTSRKINNGIVW